MEKSAIAAWKAMQIAKNLLHAGPDSKFAEYVAKMPRGIQNNVYKRLAQLKANPYNGKIIRYDELELPQTKRPAGRLAGWLVKDETASGRKAMQVNPPRYISPVSGVMDRKLLESLRTGKGFVRKGHDLYFRGTNIPWTGDWELARAFLNQAAQAGARRKGVFSRVLENAKNYQAVPATPSYSFQNYSEAGKLVPAFYRPDVDSITLPSRQLFYGLARNQHPLVQRILGGTNKVDTYKALAEHEQGHRAMAMLPESDIYRKTREAMAYTRPVLRALDRRVFRTKDDMNHPIGGTVWMEGINNFVNANPGSTLRKVYTDRFRSYINPDVRATATNQNTIARMSDDKLERAMSAIEQMDANYQGVSAGASIFGK